MVKGLYASASGMVAEITRQEVIANNLANAASSGFQRQLASFQATAPVGGTPPVGPLPLEPGVRVASVTTDFSPGTVMTTGNPLDVALEAQVSLWFVPQAVSSIHEMVDSGSALRAAWRRRTGTPSSGVRASSSLAVAR